MTKTGQRYRDVLFALAVAADYDQPLGKLQLQKFIYLADVLSPLWDLISSGGYQTYFHGPYNQAVQNAVDVLAFRGAVNIVKSNIEDRENIRVSYIISNVGFSIVQNIIEVAVLNRRYELFIIIGKYVNRQGWGELRRLVYSDPTYNTVKYGGLGRPLEPDSMLKSDSLQILYGFNNMVKEGGQLTKNNITSIFFRLLDNYQMLSKD